MVRAGSNPAGWTKEENNMKKLVIKKSVIRITRPSLGPAGPPSVSEM